MPRDETKVSFNVVPSFRYHSKFSLVDYGVKTPSVQSIEEILGEFALALGEQSQRQLYFGGQGTKQRRVVEIPKALGVPGSDTFEPLD